MEATTSDMKTKLIEKHIKEVRQVQTNLKDFRKDSQLEIEKLQAEKASALSLKQSKEEIITRLRSEKRSLIHSGENSQKLLREQIEKLSSDLNNKTEEIKKLRARVATLRNNVSKLETLNKKPALQINLNQSSTEDPEISSILV